MSVEILLAGENCQTDIRRLLSEYLAELSAYGDVDKSYPYFGAYWNEGETRWPYLILGDGEFIGFAFVNTVSPSGRGTDFSMAEFYIEPFARTRGYGLAGAKELLLKHEGQWELSIMRANARAQRFWPKVMSYTKAREVECFEHNGDIIHRFSV